jgi:GT2 family glycosyltransferase
MMRASIVIVTYGQRAVTERCLQSLQRCLGGRLGRDWELVLVDNDSPDDTAELLRAWSSVATVRLLGENRNFAGGCNAGAEVATGEVLIFLNNDTEALPGALETLVEQTFEPGVAIAGPRLLFGDGTIQHAGVAFVHHPQFGVPMPQHVFHRHDGGLLAAQATYELDCVTAACMAVRADTFRAVGGFDTGFRNGLEDVDLCLRVRVHGGRIIYRGDVSIIHHEGASRGRGAELWATAERLRAMAENDRRLIGRWSAAVEPDTELAGDLWDATLEQCAPARDGGAADVAIAGVPNGIGPAADEARGLLAVLTELGCAVAAVDPPGTMVLPRLGGHLAEVVAAARRRLAAEHAPTIHIPAGATDGWPLPQPSIVRLARARTALDLSQATEVWAASPAVAAGLVAAGLPAACVAVVAPPVPSVDAGEGGGGLLAVLPAHDRATATSVLAALRRLPRSVPVRLLPTVAGRGLEREVSSQLPGAELLGPCSDEQRFARLAATADVVLAVDPSDPFERRALVAAATGAAAVTADPLGPAAATLGTDCAAGSGPFADASMIVPALREALSLAAVGSAARLARARLVTESCGPLAIARCTGLTRVAA